MKIERDGIDSLLSAVFLFTGDAERCDRGFIVYVSDSESYTSLYKAAEEDDSKSPHDNGSLISPSYLRIMCMSFNPSVRDYPESPNRSFHHSQAIDCFNHTAE
jgi:hypothetical protein